MDYTKNYHLPQWKKEDRIMMEDFNDAMAGIEDGLSAERGALRRIAYNHLRIAEAAGGVSEQSGLFYQKLGGTTLPDNAANMLVRNDYCWLARETGLDSSSLSPYFTVNQPLVVVKDDMDACIPMNTTFAPLCSGQITRLEIKGNYNGCVSKHATFRIRFVNMITGECEVDVVRDARLSSNSLAAGVPVMDAVSLWFHNGVQYRLEVIPLDATVNGTFEMGLQGVSYYNMIDAGTVTHSLAVQEDVQGAAALVHYEAHGNGGTVSLQWNGQALTPTRTRTYVDRKGRTITEQEYRRTAELSENVNLQLTASCAVGGDLCLHGWGAVLI